MSQNPVVTIEMENGSVIKAEALSRNCAKYS